MAFLPSTQSPLDNTFPSWSLTDSADNTTTAARPMISPEDLFVMIIKTFPDYQTSLALGRYGCSLQVALGTLTNLLTMKVMTRRSLISSTTCLYFAFLAVADLFVLYFSCLRRLLYVINDHEDVYLHSTWLCRIMNFLAYFSYDFSSWILTVMTIDRFIAIRYPLKSAVISTIRNAFFTVAGVAVFCIAKNCHFFFTFELSPVAGCLGRDAHADFLNDVWPWIDATFYSFLPFSLLFFFNVLIIYCHRKALRQQRFLQASIGLSPAATRGAHINRFNQRLTTMLLIVSFTFMLMTAPKVILFCIREEVFKFFTPEGHINFPVIARYTLVSSIFDFLMWTNHTINFFLYCLSGTRFRQEFLRMLSQWLLWFRCKRHTRVSASNQCGVRNKQATNPRGGTDSQRRGSNSSVVSDDVVSIQAQPPAETEDALSRVTRWATMTFRETSTK